MNNMNNINNINNINNNQIDFSYYIGRNVFNVETDLKTLFPEHEIVIIAPNSLITADYREDRIRITHTNRQVSSITIG